MQPVNVNNLNTLPGDLVLRIADDLDNSLQIVCLASTCKDVHKIFTQAQENTFFKAIGVKSYPLSFAQGLGDSLFAKIFYLKSWNFTCLPAGSITISAFKKTRRVLHEFFPKCKRPVIEASIRFDLRDKFSLVNLANAMKMDPNHPKAEEIKQGIPIKFDKLNAKRIAIERKMLELRGSNGNNGTIAAALEKMNDASSKFTIDSHNARNALMSTGIPISHLDVYKETVLLSLDYPELEAFTAAQLVLAPKYDAYCATHRDFHNLCAEFNALCNINTTIPAGKHSEVTTKLANLLEPTTQIQKVVDFFNELGVDVLPDKDDINEGFRTLNAIMRR